MSHLRLVPLVLLGLASLALLLGVLAAPAAAPAAAQGLPTPTWRFDFLRQWATQPPLGVFNHQPTGMAFDTVGNLYVVDRGNHRVQVLDRQGVALRAFGQLGDGPGDLYFPLHVAVDAQGTAYVTDFSAHQIKRFAADGTPLPPWTGFETPYGVGVGQDGAVYVSDIVGQRTPFRGRLYKVAPDGSSRRLLVEINDWVGSLKVRRELGADVIYVIVAGRLVQKYSAAGVLLSEWNDLNLASAADVEVGADGALYVTDQNADVVVVRRQRDRQVVTERWAGFLTPQGVIVGPDGLVYVTDGEGGNFGTGRSTAMRIQRLTPGGVVVEPTWGGEEGHAPGQLVNPDAIAWDPAGYVWVHDNADGRFQQFTPDGVFVRETPRLADFKGVGAMRVDRDGNFLVPGFCRLYKLSPMGDILAVYPGSEPLCITTQEDPSINFTTLHALDLDSHDNLYGADPSNHRVVKLDRDGRRQKVYGTSDELSQPSDVAVDERGDRLYVLDEREVPIGGLTYLSMRIQVYRLSDGVLLDTWVVPNTDPDSPLDSAVVSDIEVDEGGYVYAVDVGLQTVWKLEPTKGAPVARIEPGGRGVAPGQFDQLAGWSSSFTFDPNGRLYTVEGYLNTRIQVFAQIVSTPTPTSTPSATTTPTVTQTPTATATVTDTATQAPTASPTGITTSPATTTPTVTVASTVTPTPTDVEARYRAFLPYVAR